MYVNPNYKPANKYVRPGLDTAGPSLPASVDATMSSSSEILGSAVSQPLPVVSAQKKEVVLGGVAFESSGRSLVRKDRE